MYLIFEIDPTLRLKSYSNTIISIKIDIFYHYSMVRKIIVMSKDQTKELICIFIALSEIYLTQRTLPFLRIIKKYLHLTAYSRYVGLTTCKEKAFLR